MVFLDPEPLRLRSPRTRNSSGAQLSGFFSTRQPIENPRHSNGNKFAWRKPLEERSNNPQKFLEPEAESNAPPQPTVRIVQETSNILKPNEVHLADNLKTPSFSSSVKKIADEGDTDRSELELGTKQADVRELQGSCRQSVSSLSQPSNDKRHSQSHRSNATHESGSLATRSPTPWHFRSGSAGNFSTSSTLKEGDASIFGGQSIGSRSRLSQGTTLRGTPTPHEQELHERLKSEQTAAQSGPAQALQTLDERSPEQSTVRLIPRVPVTASLRTQASHPRLDSAGTQSSSPVVRLLDTSSSPNFRKGSASSSAGRSSRRTSSTGSLPTASYLPDVSAIHFPRAQSSRDSLAQSEASLPRASSPNFAVFPSDQSYSPSSIPPSSPNFVAFYSDSTQPRSRNHALRGVASYDSIASRLQPSSRPGTGSVHPDPSSSTDTLPPLQVPKKRLRHKPASASLGSASNAEGSSMVTQEEIDTLPYPRYQFSSHLSTIASESERASRRSSIPLSHFSLGSGVTTLDDASSIPLSSRRRSAPLGSVLPSPEPERSSGAWDEPGDMTLGLFREESAKPQPLFKDKRYDGPLPPLPPIPKGRDSDEDFDTVSELGMPQLREQRSARSLRTRSNSTPSQSQSRRSQTHSRHLSQISYVDSDRGSHASSIFPVWAKNFYMNNAQLASASKVSFGDPPPRPGNPHLRNHSSWTERSITSRLGTGYSEIDNNSPRSSHFLPSIFRPKTRDRSMPGKKRKSKGRPSGDSSRPDSMAIAADPLPTDDHFETTESGQPKFGELKDADEPRRPLPRKYSKQKQWDDMTFPRPMTKDRLSDFHMSLSEPRLGPSKRVSNRLSMWRAPSFVESLDTLFKSRTNRQILLFSIGFVLPLCWMVAAVMPIPRRPVSVEDLEKTLNGSEDDVAKAMMEHEAGDAEKRWTEEKLYLKARWWRSLNRIMSVVGILVIAAVASLTFCLGD